MTGELRTGFARTRHPLCRHKARIRPARLTLSAQVARKQPTCQLTCRPACSTRSALVCHRLARPTNSRRRRRRRRRPARLWSREQREVDVAKLVPRSLAAALRAAHQGNALGPSEAGSIAHYMY